MESACLLDDFALSVARYDDRPTPDNARDAVDAARLAWSFVLGTTASTGDGSSCLVASFAALIGRLNFRLCRHCADRAYVRRARWYAHLADLLTRRGVVAARTAITQTLEAFRLGHDAN